MKRVLTFLLALILSVHSVFAGALSFDGTDDYVNLGSSSVLGSNSLTVSLWVNVGTWNTDYIWADFDGGGSTSNGSLAVSTTGNQHFQWYQSGGTLTLGSTTSRTIQTWYHVCVTRDDVSKTVNFFINGNLDGSGSYTGTPNALQGSKYIGRSSPTFGDYVDAKIEDVAFFNIPLSTDVVRSIYMNGRGVKYSGNSTNRNALIGFWPLDDFKVGVTATGTGTVLDYSNNKIHGTPTNSPTGAAGNLLYADQIFNARLH